MRIETRSTLNYTVNSTSAFLFQIAVSNNNYQRVIEESFQIDPPIAVEQCHVHSSGNRMMRLVAEPGSLIVRYYAVVELTQYFANPSSLGESLYSDLPVKVLPYLNPSRYCESDRLAKFAWDEFGALEPGYGRVSAIVDWVNYSLDYIPGSTGPTTTACDVLIQRSGVCRDYAHLTIALCRAMGIPARYLAGYAVDLHPQDFHGFCEVWLGDGWYLFDATRLAPIAGFVRIGTGRDAADVSFATFIGSVDTSINPLVSAIRIPLSDIGGESNSPGINTAVSIG